MRGKFLLFSFSLLFSANVFAQSEALLEKRKQEKDQRPVEWVDNNRYWKKMAKMGKATLNPEVKVPQAVFTGTNLKARSLKNYNSPDVVLHDKTTYQSENSICIDPNNPNIVLNSNNSTDAPVTTIYGANAFISKDKGKTWGGQKEGAGVKNSGDPSAVIGRSGRQFIGFIDASNGQGVSYSDDQGQTWTPVTVGTAPAVENSLLDKNHLWIDNSLDSDFEGNLYDSWTPIKGANGNQVEIVRSEDGGETWTDPTVISRDVKAGVVCQGVNIKTGPNGEVYVVYAIYDNFPAAENAIGLSRSFDGGKTWEPAVRIIENIKGIRKHPNFMKEMRVNSFPSMAVDVSKGPNKGNIYVSWTNIGEPGINEDGETDAYVIISSDKGKTWSEPKRINQDPKGNGSIQYFPWMCCDPVTGVVSCVFYDDRNVGGVQTEVFCANSLDGGKTWEDFKVSDVAFTPQPIPKMSSKYMGDYLAIASYDGMVYPTWTDNRIGAAMTYCSPYQVEVLKFPTDLIASVDKTTGTVSLNWQFEGADDFTTFVIRRGDEQVLTTTEKSASEKLTDFGYYDYTVTAKYKSGNESFVAKTKLQYGDPICKIGTKNITSSISAGSVATQDFEILNSGQLPLNYKLVLEAASEDRAEITYCDALGGGDEYIQRVQLADLDNKSTSGTYNDFTDKVANLDGNVDYDITITSGSGMDLDNIVAFVDWNQNGDFDDDAKVVFDKPQGLGPFHGKVRVPKDAVNGKTRMRIRLNYGIEAFSCGRISYGETEDYTLNVRNWLNIDKYEGTIAPGKKVSHKAELSAVGMNPGSYNMNIKVITNATENAEQQIPVAMEVYDNPFPITVKSEFPSYCAGEIVRLDVDVENADQCTFKWTSIPEGFTSDKKNPSFVPKVTTRFLVEVTKDGKVSKGGKSISVGHPRDFDLGPDKKVDLTKTVKIGIEEQHGELYSWTPKAIDPMITVKYKGNDKDNYELKVITANNCVSKDDINIEWVKGVGVEEVEVQDGFRIYPNPTKSKVYLAIFQGFSEDVTLDVYNMKGVKVFRKDITTIGTKASIDVSKLPKGVYTFVLSSKGRFSQQKLVVE
ncbi:MAG: GEVED domain-containing protein [Bacteroidales bacterium]